MSDPCLRDRRAFVHVSLGLGSRTLGALLLAKGTLAWNRTSHGAEKNWDTRLSVGRIRCHADFPVDESSDWFPELNGLQDELTRTLGIDAGRGPIELYLFRDQGSYRRHLAEAYPSIPYRRALFVQSNGPGRVLAYQHRDILVDLRHEGTHALLHSALDMVPLWLDEGLAEYFEMAPTHRANHHPHLSSFRWSLRTGFVPSLARLEQLDDLSQMGPREYRSAWAWAHFLLHGPVRAHRTLVSFLGDIQKGEPPGALSDRLVQVLPDPTRHLVRHFKAWAPV